MNEKLNARVVNASHLAVMHNSSSIRRYSSRYTNEPARVPHRPLCPDVFFVNIIIRKRISFACTHWTGVQAEKRIPRLLARDRHGPQSPPSLSRSRIFFSILCDSLIFFPSSLGRVFELFFSLTSRLHQMRDRHSERKTRGLRRAKWKRRPLDPTK